MARTQSFFNLIDDWDPAQRQRRINRRLDARMEGLARMSLSPYGDAGLPLVTRVETKPLLADQTLTLYGENFLQGGEKAELTTDDGVLNTQIDWESVLPGKDGNNITLALVDTGALSVTVVGSAVTVNINAGVTTAAQIVAAVLASATARVLIRGTASGTGLGTPAALAATALEGGIGRGDYDVESAIVTAVTRWTDTQIDLVLDLSGVGSFDQILILVVADGKEHQAKITPVADSAKAAIERGGVGCLLLTGDTAAGESFIIGTETWTFVAGAPAAQFEVQESLAAGAATAATRVAAALNDAAFGSDLVSAHVVAGSNCVALVPKDAEGLAGNYVLDAALTAQMTDQDMQGGADVYFRGAFPLTYVITAEDVARWAAGEYRPVACFPFTAQPNLTSMLFVRPNGAAYDEIGSTFTSRVRFAQSDNDYWVMELLDPAPADFQADDELRIVIGL